MFAFLPVLLRCTALQCHAQSTWRRCASFRQHDVGALVSATGLCVPVFFWLYVALSAFICLCAKSRSGLPELIITFP